MNSEKQQNKKYYYQIDALRSFMLLLGIVLHSGLSFMKYSLGDSWIYKHQETSLFFDTLVLFIHTFRVPVFFVLAGFFLEISLEKHSVNQVLLKKTKRIGIPLVIGVLFLFPIVEYSLKKSIETSFTIEKYLVFWKTSNYNTMHLWFLYYLLLFYSVHALSSNLFKKLKQKLQQQKEKLIGIILVVFMVISIFILTKNPKSFDGDYSLIPNLGSILYYLLYYVLGIFFYQSKYFFHFVKKYYMLFFGIGYVHFAILLYSRSIVNIKVDFSNFENILFVITSYSFIVAFFGLFSVISKKHNKNIQYISKSSYLVYVIHLPILTILLSYFVNLQLNIYILFVFLISFTLIVSYAIFEVITRIKKKITSFQSQ